MENTENKTTQSPMSTVDKSVVRRKLFMTQSCLALFLTVSAAFVYGIRLHAGSWFKVGIAPFGAFSLLFFLLFLFARLVEKFNGEEGFSRKNSVLAGGLIAGLSVVVYWINHLVSVSAATIEQLVFCYASMGSVILFMYFRTRNLWTMAALTALAQGLVLQLVFG
ncbi:hypothetical protein BVX94_03305 [bacterium B17]|nr:hypothetical protein BVX94_03305 [bacterium B17]